MTIKHTLLLGLAALTTACTSDFLNLPPQGSVTASTFYQSGADFDQALTGAYQVTRPALTGISSWLMGEMRSDNTHYEYNGALRGTPELKEQLADFTDNDQNQHTNDKYYADYLGIARANIVLNRLPGAGLKADVTGPITGEARFLRALFYFDLVQYYGSVPLYLSEISAPGESYLGKSSVEDIYKIIIADAQDAVSKLPVPKFPQTGRATKGSAAMLLAHVYMVRKDYAGAETLLRTVAQMGYTLLPDYASVFSPANKNSTESIFEVQFQQGNQGQGSDFTYWFIPASTTTKPITGVDGNVSEAGWNVPTAEMIAAYEKGDKRLDASIGLVEGTGVIGNFTPTGVVSIVGYTPKTGIVAKPFVKKYLHAHSQIRNTDDNWPIYRYADALLLLAESLNEQSKTGEAVTLLNQVRTRAGLAPTTQTSQVQLRDAIARDRRLELAFENKRYLDLVRTGKAVEVLTAHGATLKGLYSNIQARAYTDIGTKLLAPIPYREKQINSLLN